MSRLDHVVVLLVGIVTDRDGKDIDCGRKPTEVMAVEKNAMCKCEASAWLLGENGEDG